MTLILGILFPTNHQEPSGLVVLGNIGQDEVKETRCVDFFQEQQVLGTLSLLNTPSAMCHETPD
ncbi:hypothetical protein [Arthrobacter sp. StoSoilB5]|uniref:hypothetical protein n=1 Tax=Arthrobacter sp. StoSoilB5 TaxID=2830992 RepID=UPI001CC4CB5D|nr:hypothetical protein [Arthrobacter sp. StoSoilB5]